MYRIAAAATCISLLACTGEKPAQVVRDSVADTTTAGPTEPAIVAEKPGLIRLEQPLPGSVITSPLTIQGEAKGPWYFEASFPVYLVTAAGDTIARAPAQAQGEWMTENMVPFSLSLEFTAPAADSGTLVLAKDNPSGLAVHADELRVPVRFR